MKICLQSNKLQTLHRTWRLEKINFYYHEARSITEVLASKPTYLSARFKENIKAYGQYDGMGMVPLISCTIIPFRIISEQFDELE